jgi:hypothetical protein
MSEVFLIHKSHNSTSYSRKETRTHVYPSILKQTPWDLKICPLFDKIPLENRMFTYNSTGSITFPKLGLILA